MKNSFGYCWRAAICGTLGGMGAATRCQIFAIAELHSRLESSVFQTSIAIQCGTK